MLCSYSLWETRHGSWTQYMSCWGYTEKKNDTFCLSLNTLPTASQRFCWLFLAADAHWADDLRQLLTATSGLFPGPWWTIPSSASKSFDLDYLPLPYIYLYWNSCATSVSFVQFCEILQDVVIGMAFDCPKEIRNTCRPGDFVHSPFCRLWMKMLNKTSLSKHSLPPLHLQSPFICLPALNLLSVQKSTFPSNTWLGFLIDNQGETKIQGFWKTVEMSFSLL